MIDSLDDYLLNIVLVEKLRREFSSLLLFRAALD